MLLPLQLLVALLLLLARDACIPHAVLVYELESPFFDNRLTHEDRARLRDCPCPNSSNRSELSPLSLCLPIDYTGKRPRKEVFAFSIATDDRWKHYDWDQVRICIHLMCLLSRTLACYD